MIACRTVSVQRKRFNTVRCENELSQKEASFDVDILRIADPYKPQAIVCPFATTYLLDCVGKLLPNGV